MHAGSRRGVGVTGPGPQVAGSRAELATGDRQVAGTRAGQGSPPPGLTAPAPPSSSRWGHPPTTWKGTRVELAPGLWKVQEGHRGARAPRLYVLSREQLCVRSNHGVCADRGVCMLTSACVLTEACVLTVACVLTAACLLTVVLGCW